MKITRYYFWMVAALSWMGLGACERMVEEDVLSKGTEVSFNVATGYESETRTSFSGAIVGTSSTYERIDWTDGDVFQVYSPEAATGASAHTADYTVTHHFASGRNSYAVVSSTNPLHWAEGTNTFYAFYPAPTAGNGVTMTENVVTGLISSAYDATESSSGSGVFPADMANRGYMYAVSSGSLTEESDVPLVFHPLMTMFEFKLRTSEEYLITALLQTVKLTSTQDNGSFLAGGFTATLDSDEDATFSSVSVTGGSNEITVTLPDGGVPLPTGADLKVTLLGLPMTQTKLRLELIFEGDRTRSLDLKNSGEWITVPAGQKMYVNNLVVPGWGAVGDFDYFISTTDPTDLLYSGGTSTNGSVTSYRTNGSVTERVAWETDGYYADAACTDPYDGSDASNRPDWLEADLSGTGSPDGTEETVYIPYSASNHPTGSIDRSVLPDTGFGSGSSTSNYYNLSNPSAMTSDDIAESANCYIVNGPGYYRIPLVMGNGVKNNAVNANTNAWQGGSATNQVLFKDYKGNAGTAIMSPYLHKSGAGVGTPASAFVVWEDVQDLIEVSNTTDYTLSGTPVSVTGSGDSQVYWLNFHVQGETKGNAVIAVSDEEGTVMWSWHIWMTDFIPKNYPGYASSADQDIVVTNYAGINYTMMPVNLGYVQTGYERTYDSRTVYVKLRQVVGTATAVMEITQQGGTSPSVAHAPYYQWGRKDAMWPSDGSSASQATCYGRNSTESTKSTTSSSSRPALNVVIMNPGVFYYNSVYSLTIISSYNSEGGSNLWSAANTVLTANDNPVIKTIYDPCPAGYHVPASNAFTGFTSTGADTGKASEFNVAGGYNKGWNFYTDSSASSTIFFPQTGYRSYMNTPPTRLFKTSDGFYWTAIPFVKTKGSNPNPRFFSFSSSNVNPLIVGSSPTSTNPYYLSAGMAVRPVED